MPKRTYYPDNPIWFLFFIIFSVIFREEPFYILSAVVAMPVSLWWQRIVIEPDCIRMVGASGLRRKFTPNQLIIYEKRRWITIEYDSYLVGYGTWMKIWLLSIYYKKSTFENLKTDLLAFSQKRTNKVKT